MTECLEPHHRITSIAIYNRLQSTQPMIAGPCTLITGASGLVGGDWVKAMRRRDPDRAHFSSCRTPELCERHCSEAERPYQPLDCRAVAGTSALTQRLGEGGKRTHRFILITGLRPRWVPSRGTSPSAAPGRWVEIAVPAAPLQTLRVPRARARSGTSSTRSAATGQAARRA